MNEGEIHAAEMTRGRMGISAATRSIRGGGRRVVCRSFFSEIMAPVNRDRKTAADRAGSEERGRGKMSWGDGMRGLSGGTHGWRHGWAGGRE